MSMVTVGKSSEVLQYAPMLASGRVRRRMRTKAMDMACRLLDWPCNWRPEATTSNISSHPSCTSKEHGEAGRHVTKGALNGGSTSESQRAEISGRSRYKGKNCPAHLRRLILWRTGRQDVRLLQSRRAMEEARSMYKDCIYTYTENRSTHHTLPIHKTLSHYSPFTLTYSQHPHNHGTSRTSGRKKDHITNPRNPLGNPAINNKTLLETKR